MPVNASDLQSDAKPGTFVATLSLFTSFGTLICCALPALFVTLGAGATLASIVSAAPWLVALSKYKIWTFSASFIMLIIAGVLQWRGRLAACPIDPALARACRRNRRINKVIYGLSLGLWLVGFFFAFIAVEVFY